MDVRVDARPGGEVSLVIDEKVIQTFSQRQALGTGTALIMGSCWDLAQEHPQIAEAIHGMAADLEAILDQPMSLPDAGE